MSNLDFVACIIYMKPECFFSGLEQTSINIHALVMMCSGQNHLQYNRYGYLQRLNNNSL